VLGAFAQPPPPPTITDGTETLLSPPPSYQYPYHHNWLTKIELSFSTSGYFAFFGASVGHPTVQIDEAKSAGPLLRSISTLKTLHLVFLSPYHDRNSNPWQDWANKQWDDNHIGFQQTLVPIDMRMDVCYRSMPHWILTLALPYIKHIPHVLLEGCIKTDVKTKWNKILSDAYNFRDGDIRAEGYMEWRKEMYNISSYTVMGSPPCVCPLPCGKKGWRRLSVSLTRGYG
jgi:hypothetical protein